MFCPRCGTNAENNFCPNCGCDLRNIARSLNSKSKDSKNKYDVYMRYYPDKLAAIRALRIDTGMGLAEANRIINDLFGMTDDDLRRADDMEHERHYQECERAKASVKASVKKTAKTVGAVAGVGLFAAIKTILEIAKEYK